MADKVERFDITLNRLNNLANKIRPPTSQGSMNDAREPDRDAIKMFIGQIPRDWSESNCRKLLEEFGDIHSLNILRDKKTGMSRGCCFVTFYTRRSALEAQDALHNIRVLPGMHHPIQMKPADSENRNERKLFIGMISKNFTENEVRKMFSAFGTVEECTVLRDSNGQSKGCAFVTFSSRTNALNAIKTMNHSQTLEGCTSPMVVKFADTQKEKNARKQQKQLVQQLWAAVASPASSWSLERPGTNLPVSQLIFDGSPTLMSMAQHSQQQQLAATAASLALHQQIASVNNADHLTLTAATLAPVLAAALCGTGNNNGVSGCLSSSSTLNGNGSLAGLNFAQHSFQNQLSSMTSLNKLANSNSPQLSLACNQSGKPLQGPEGANLFIYHLPADYTDTDLAQTFAPFGNIISSKVFIDKNTNLSKCFGFVSFDNPLSAQTAIQAMNGFQIGNKRLKVQLKKIKDKPY